MHAQGIPKSTTKMALRWIILILCTSLSVGACGAVFLHALEWTTVTFQAHPTEFVLALPFLGLLTVWAYSTFAATSASGIKTLIEQIHLPQTEPLPRSMAPAILGGTLLAHLGGASVGREGTALQMGAACADQFSRFCKLTSGERQTLLFCGVSAGFAAVFGTPLAAAIFSLEFVRRRTWQFIPCLTTAILADEIGQKIFGVQHVDYHGYFQSHALVTITGLAWATALGVAFGYAAWLYLKASRDSRAAFTRILNPYYRVLLGSGTFVVIILWWNLAAYTGLGLSSISEAFVQPSPAYFWVLKIFLTVLCLAAGFKGGEVTPLFCIGATLGACLSPLTNLPIEICVGLGFVSVFAGAGAVPIACTAMAFEMFGFATGIYALAACFVSTLIVGKQSLYSES
jgi:H+/Cl- antiporter ClcA